MDPVDKYLDKVMADLNEQTEYLYGDKRGINLDPLDLDDDSDIEENNPDKINNNDDNDSSDSPTNTNSSVKFLSKKLHENLKNNSRFYQAESSSAFNFSQGLHNVCSPASPYLKSLRNLSLNDNLNSRNIDRKRKGYADYRTTIVEELDDYSGNSNPYCQNYQSNKRKESVVFILTQEAMLLIFRTLIQDQSKVAKDLFLEKE
ncbi:hypothetical protein BD770DRAFT_432746 [Pilaira anomala]|nr:hypothetical protein BD770DRAFT_432746 [Pilaira anomala]